MAPDMTTRNLRGILVSQLVKRTVEDLLDRWAMTVAELTEEFFKAVGPLGGVFTNEAWLLERVPLPMEASSWWTGPELQQCLPLG